MAKTEHFPAGARVVVRDEEWLVTRCDAVANGGYALHLTGLSGIVREREAVYLTELEDRIEELKPEATEFEWDVSPRHRRSRLYLEALLRATPPTDARIYLGHRGVMRKARFQLEPARLALEALRPRILIADGVGLGKTLEAGVLLTELIRRGRGTRVLVVALKSLLTQFQQELWARFAIPLVRLDSEGIQRMRRRIPASRNPFTVVDKAIISIDTLKDDGRYRHFLENCRFDVVVIDECHNVANPASDRGRLAALLAERADALILTSATPHNGRPASFAHLVNMLEPTAIADPEHYSADDIRGLYTRRFKKDVRLEVEEQFTERDLDLESVPATPPEEAVYDRLASIKFHALDRNRSSGSPLFRTTLIKAWLSSPEACLETIGERMKTLDARERKDREGVAADLAALEALQGLVAAAAGKATAKQGRLIELMRSMGYGSGRGAKANVDADRLIVFSERIQTLRTLEAAVQTAFGLTDGQVQVFTSEGLSDVEQQQVVEDFGKADSPIRLLLATDVASEGVNLHFFCHRMIHFDIPWSPIVLEQRNGRIDRFGQRQTPWIRYLLTRTKNREVTDDLRILEVLIEKEKHAYQNLGDAGQLMGLRDARRESLRIAEAIEKREQLELFFEPKKEERDLLQLLLDGVVPASATDPCADAPTFFPDDFEFARTALQELGPRLGDVGLEILADSKSVKLTAPPELDSLRLRIPEEAWPAADRFHLSADRELIAGAIENARKCRGEWPAVQLLWELHPVFRWLVDKVLVGFPRHTAPLLASARVGASEVVWLLMGSFGNRRGQSWLSEWFGVRCRAGAKPEILDFAGFLAATSLGNSTNVLRDADVGIPPPVEKSRAEALAAARAHLAGRFARHVAGLEAPSREFFLRLESWHEGAVRLVDGKKADLRARGITRGPDFERADHARHRIDALLSTRRSWAEEILGPASDVPYLRIAAVVVAP